MQKSLDIISNYIIYSRTDAKGIITYASKEFSRISGYTQKELVGHSHNIIRHEDTPDTSFKQMWETLKKKENHGEGNLKTKPKRVLNIGLMPIFSQNMTLKIIL